MKNGEKNPMQRKAELRFLFLMCNDPVAMRQFYGELLGLPCEGQAEQGYLAVNAGIDLLFFKGDHELPVLREWAWQPGYQAGQGHFTSWSFSFDEASFRKAAKAVSGGRCPKLTERPVWRKDEYWAMTLQDPMGNTVEVYWVPNRRPDSLEWND